MIVNVSRAQIVSLPSSYNKYLQYLYDLPISTSVLEKEEEPLVSTCNVRVESVRIVVK